MLRYNPSEEGFVGGTSKIRKRVSSSSSPSSSLLQTYRFKRAIMVGKRGGSTTPAPNWRVNPKSPSACSKISESSRQQGPVSARKLANALWELNKIPSPQFSENVPTRRSKKIPKSLPRRLSDPSHSPMSDRSERSRPSCHRRVMPIISQRVRRNEHNHRTLDLLPSASLMEIDARSRSLTPTSSTVLRNKSCVKDLQNSLTSSKELVKLLSRIWGQEGQQSYGNSLFSALRVELDRARTQLNQLAQEQNLNDNEINSLKNRFKEEKALWKIKEQERIKSAAHSIIDELESEQKLRRRAERLNKKLGAELANTRATLEKAVKELQSERRSREIVEQICNEVITGIGEDRAEVEHLKRESARVREELEKERKMLHIADEWREERVQMKLLEAKVQFEEKNAAVDQLRTELEAFLEAKRPKDEGQFAEKGEVEDEARDSIDSDLHSIELNMESNKGYSWSYGNKLSEANSKLVSLVEDSERRSSEDSSEESRITGKKTEELNQDAERYVSVKKLRDHMLAGTKIVLPRGLASPTRQWSRNQDLQDTGSQGCEGLKVAEIVKAIRESGSGSIPRLSNSSSVQS